MASKFLPANTLGKAVFLVSLVYFFCWITTYSIIMNFDFRFVRNYFYLSWTGGFELPGYIQAISIIATIIVTPVFLFLYRNKKLK